MRPTKSPTCSSLLLLLSPIFSLSIWPALNMRARSRHGAELTNARRQCPERYLQILIRNLQSCYSASNRISLSLDTRRRRRRRSPCWPFLFLSKRHSQSHLLPPLHRALNLPLVVVPPDAASSASLFLLPLPGTGLAPPSSQRLYIRLACLPARWSASQPAGC